jgi:predicted small lipoprotein YifL
LDFVFFAPFAVKKRSSWPLWLFVVAALSAAACGKKGPPLAPILHIPAPVAMIQAQRVGSDAFVTLTVPAKNIDGSMPVDISRIEVYGYTGLRAPSNARWVEVAQLVATIPVIPPPPPDTPPIDPATTDVSKGALTGTMVTVMERLTSQKLVQGKVPEEAVRRGATPIAAAAANEPDVLRRFYMAIAFSERGRPGPPGSAAEFSLVETPEAPAFVNAYYSETTMNLEWPPSGGIVGFLFDTPLPPEDPPLNEALEPVVPTAPAASNATIVLPTGPVKYNVYREAAPDPFAFPEPSAPVAWATAPPMPINPMPLSTPSFADSVEFERELCYTVRPIRGVPPNTVAGDASPPNCFTPVDIFPPAAPVRLVAVADEGGISLIWEPNAEPDVAGYMVLRGEAGDATLEPLTPTAVAEPRFRDTHVTAGKKYTYAVVAVDSRLPVANVSGESNRVEETAR